jgi:hypothetical protein
MSESTRLALQAIQDEVTKPLHYEIERLRAENEVLRLCNVGVVVDSTDYARGWNDCRQAVHALKRHTLAALAAAERE